MHGLICKLLAEASKARCSHVRLAPFGSGLSIAMVENGETTVVDCRTPYDHVGDEALAAMYDSLLSVGWYVQRDGDGLAFYPNRDAAGRADLQHRWPAMLDGSAPSRKASCWA